MKRLSNFTSNTFTMNKRLTSFLFLILTGLSLQAQTRKYSNEFLAIGVGARSLGMSGATVATVNDVTSGYWNPAGLTGLKSNFQIALMHSEYFAGIAKYDYGAIAKQIDEKSALGISFIRFGVDDIPNTTELIDANGQIDYDRITTFSAADYAFILSYAKKLKLEGLTFGANAKVIRRKVGDFAGAWGFGLDAGAQYQTEKWKLGLMARDITSTFNSWSFNLDDETKYVFEQTGNELPQNGLEITLPKLILGAGRMLSYKKFTGLAELNLDVTFDGKRNVLLRGNPVSVDPHLGIEIGYDNLIFLRGGIGNIQQVQDLNGLSSYVTQPNIGVGVKLKGVYIDYALANVGQTFGLVSHVFSLKIDLNPKKAAVETRAN
jgi:Type IX secretion system protein PorV